MKYRYALRPDGKKADVLTLDANERDSRSHFKCPGCGRHLVAVLGSRRERHFRHKAHADLRCSRETYLHRLAKRQIAEGFEKARAEGTRYDLILPARRVCRRWEQELGFKCERSDGWNVYDLTEHFDAVRMESSVQGYIADVLLSSSRTGAGLLIEVAVTHGCEPEKLNSGLRIVEVSVTDEEQIAALGQRLDARASSVTTHNLRSQHPIEVGCTPGCGAEVAAFHVFKSGKSLFQVDAPPRVARTKGSSSTVYTRVVDDCPHGIAAPYLALDGYRREALIALTAGAAIKCCWLCRYAGFRTLEKPVFCRVKRQEVGVNDAVECKFFRLETSSR